MGGAEKNGGWEKVCIYISVVASILCTRNQALHDGGCVAVEEKGSLTPALSTVRNRSISQPL